MIWWYWVLLGFLLLGIEMVTPGGFYILFFGLAGIDCGRPDRHRVRTGRNGYSGSCSPAWRFCRC